MTSSSLTHLSLFSGIGGIDLAAEWAGFRSVGQVERDPYCQQVLQKNFQNTYIWNDIHDLTIDTYQEHCGEQSPTVLSGGFPCQPFSVAGLRKGEEDDRYLWPEMLRIIAELRPSWVLGENVAGITSMVKHIQTSEMGYQTNLFGEKNTIYEDFGHFILNGIKNDLEKIGYSIRPFIIPACGVGAIHHRNRIFIVANTNHPQATRQRENSGQILPFTESEGSDMGRAFCSHPKGIRCGQGGLSIGKKQKESVSSVSGEYATNTNSITRTQENTEADPFREERKTRKGACWGGRGRNPNIWLSEPAVGRVADGVPSRVDRLRALGNAVVPQQVYPILQGIADIENNNKEDENE